MFMASRLREDGFNSIAFSGYAFAKDEKRASYIATHGLFALLRDTIVPDGVIPEYESRKTETIREEGSEEP